MIRLIGSVFVYNGEALQTHAFENYSPLGGLKVVSSIFNQHCVDEIFISTRRNSNEKGPSEYVLKTLYDLNLSTPIIYSGGIETISDVRLCLESGVDRVGLNSSLFHMSRVKEIINYIGIQGVVAIIPFASIKGSFFAFNCKTRRFDMTVKKIIDMLPDKVEISLIDMASDGESHGFSKNILNNINGRRLILQGGVIGDIDKIEENEGSNKLFWSECATQNFRNKMQCFIDR